MRAADLLEKLTRLVHTDPTAEIVFATKTGLHAVADVALDPSAEYHDHEHDVPRAGPAIVLYDTSADSEEVEADTGAAIA